MQNPKSYSIIGEEAKIRCGLLEILEYPGNSTSAIVINNEFVITSAINFQSHLNNVVRNYLQNNRVACFEDDIFLKTNEIEFQLNYCENGVIQTRNARLLYLFKSESILESLSKIDSNYYVNFSDSCKILYSSFCILKIIEKDTEYFINSISSFIQPEGTYEKVQKLDEIHIIATPLGVPKFLETVYSGTISNIVGKNECLYLASITLTNGCEGSPVFDGRGKLIGITICTRLPGIDLNFDVDITIVANFCSLLEEFLTEIKQCSFQHAVKVPNVSQSIGLISLQKSLVILSNNALQGTGVFVKILDRKFIITCGHCIEDVTKPIVCNHMNVKFHAKCMWKHFVMGHPCDLAILETSNHVPNDCFLSIADEQPKPRDIVYNIGFSFLTLLLNRSSNNIDHEANFNPDINEGRIMKVMKHEIIFNGKQLPGQSGGALINRNGQVIGISSVVVREDKSYAQFNLAVSLYNMKDVIEMFVMKNDSRLLDSFINTTSRL